MMMLRVLNGNCKSHMCLRCIFMWAAEASRRARRSQGTSS
jgi:hypothetical protein